MFVITDNETLLCRAAILRGLAGKPPESLVDLIAAEKVIDFAAARARLRPPETLVRSLTRSLTNIDEAFAAAQRIPTDG